VHVESLRIESFRNYERAALDLAPGLNLIAGRNAQGKTNLLEAIHFLSGLGSPRGQDSNVVRNGSERAYLHGSIRRAERSLTIDLEIEPGRGTRALVNGSPASGVRALAASFVCVFFGPDELELIKGGPSRRRRFLDELVVKLRPARDNLRRELERVLKQRNALLRTAPRSASRSVDSTLEVWDQSLARTGAALTRARLDALTALEPFARKRYEAIAGGGELQLAYESDWLTDSGAEESEIEEILLRELTAARPREIERGVTLVGPHRDDLSVILSSGGTAGSAALDARAYASQGDQRTCALALRLAEHDLITDALGEEPVLLLDDVFSELDPSRRGWLSDSVRTGGQVVLTSAEPGAHAAARPDLVVTVEAGAISLG
jgi:DNA replication and repair protein RecF